MDWHGYILRIEAFSIVKFITVNTIVYYYSLHTAFMYIVLLYAAGNAFLYSRVVVCVQSHHSLLRLLTCTGD